MYDTRKRRGPVLPAAVCLYMIYLFEEKLAKSQNTRTARASYFWDIFHTSSHEIT